MPTGPSSASMKDMGDPILAPHCAAAGTKKKLCRGFGTMPNFFVKTADTDMHHCDFCVM